MPDKLVNFTQFDIKKKRSVKVPHRWVLSAMFVFSLVLGLILIYKVYVLSESSSRIDGLKAQQKYISEKVSKNAGSNIIARMNAVMLKQRDGFFPYFKYMSSFKYTDVFLNKIELEFKGKATPNIILRGEAQTPEALRFMLAQLSMSELFVKPPLRINMLSVLSQQIKQKKKKPRTTVEKIKKEGLRRLYSFEVVNDSFIKPKSKRRR